MVHPVLTDGHTLTATNGVFLDIGNGQNSHRQAAGTSTLTATGGYSQAGIGSNVYGDGGKLSSTEQHYLWRWRQAGRQRSSNVYGDGGKLVVNGAAMFMAMAASWSSTAWGETEEKTGVSVQWLNKNRTKPITKTSSNPHPRMK